MEQSSMQLGALQEAVLTNRRSDVFRRRSSTFQTSSSREVLSLHKDTGYKEYIAEAAKEKKEWVELHSQRHSSFSAASDKYEELKTEKQEVSLEDVKQYLTDEDLEYFSQRPDYAKLNKDLDSYFEAHSIDKIIAEKQNSSADLIYMKRQVDILSVSNTICSYAALSSLSLPC